jgi:tetratricopeptide (TPR) repeat protein
MIWRVTTHLGTLEKWDKQLDKAVELYEKALDGASLLDDPGLKLECYQSLGDLAGLQGDFDKAHDWYTEQLNLATTSWRISIQVVLIRELLRLSCKNHHQMSIKHTGMQGKHYALNKR